jgi:hypothetical protein
MTFKQDNPLDNREDNQSTKAIARLELIFSIPIVDPGINRASCLPTPDMPNLPCDPLLQSQLIVGYLKTALDCSH